MDVTCDKCQTEYEFDDALVSEQGTSVRCTQCGHRFKVRRPTGGSAPEVWIVRTVDGLALEFRALRELKNAIASGKVGRDDVLSRGAGRPRRLASIAELEPFFTVQPRPMLNTAPGLGGIESPRPRKQTPSGLGPGARDQSIAIPLPRDQAVSSVRVPPPSQAPGAKGGGFEDDETTAVRDRRPTKELRTLGEDPPASAEPPTIPEPPLSGEAPATVLGVAPAPAAAGSADPVVIPRPPDSITKTMAYGTPSSRAEAQAASEREPDTNRRAAPVEATEQSAAPHLPQTAPKPAAPSARPKPSAASPAELADTAPAVASRSAERLDAPASSRAAIPPPVGEPTPTPPPAGEEPAETPAPREASADPRRDALDTRASVVTPTPPEARYSLYEEGDRDVVPSGLRTSNAVSRRSAGSMRLIAGLVVGGALAFVGVVVFQKFLSQSPSTAPSATDQRVLDLVDAGEKAMRDGDLEGAKEQFDKASGVDEKHPRLAKSRARLAAVRAELVWLEVRILPSDDRDLDAAKRRFREAAERAQKAVAEAEAALSDDPDVKRVSLDVKRISGDLAGARKLASAVASAPSGETELSLGALDMADPTLTATSPSWKAILERLKTAADAEGGLGRARALLIYAAARAGDPARARSELELLARAPRSHPLEAELRRFVERVEKGETPPLTIDDLPSVPSAASGSPEVSALKVAQEALARGQAARAEDLFREILQRDKGNAEALAGLAQATLAQGKTAQAIAHYQRVVDASPSNVSAVMTLAGLLYDAGKRGDAAALYKKALDLGVTGAGAELARSRTQAAPSSGSGGSPPPSSGGTTSGGEPPPPDPPPETSTTGGSDVPPDL